MIDLQLAYVGDMRVVQYVLVSSKVKYCATPPINRVTSTDNCRSSERITSLFRCSDVQNSLNNMNRASPVLF